ncbi:LamG domain-containing protein [Actinokineospora xionganensis]|uniref:LamG domain-containing protein n=1 Tax=Actinokineospora xionganensis TaxID=2684470 RepID=A0ABR7LH45_9PSEU|nr:LamG domain-containing protein [Actinokineospora xionganensis]MBC6451701.1 LamG domain-containing protein [Actinokineospora xionganensis]
MHVETIHSYHCSGATPTHLYLAGWVDGNTTWNHQPGASGGSLSSGNATKHWKWCPGNPGGMDLSAKSAIETAARNKWGETTFLLAGEREGDNTSWRRFDLNPYLVVMYNSYPAKPGDLSIDGSGGQAWEAKACGSYVGVRQPRLRARLADPDGDVLNALFHIGGKAVGVANVPSGSFGEVTLPSDALTADGQYNWHVTVGDNDLLGPQSDTCSLILDTTVPGQPVVTSAEYPQGTSAGAVGVSGKFTLSAPAGTSDIAHYLYSFTSQGDDPATKATPPALNGQAVVSWSPSASGPYILSVRSVDRAGNKSAIRRYQIDVADYRVGISGKVARWSFEDSPADVSGAKDLTYVGPPPPGGYFVDGHSGRSVLLESARSETYQAKDSLLRTDASFTVSAWVSLAATDQDATVASQDGDRVSAFRLRYSSADNRWAFTTSTSDTDTTQTAHQVLSEGPPVLNTWAHLTAVYDKPGASMKLYVDGVLSGSTTVTSHLWHSTGLFLLGAGKAVGKRADFLTGSMDSARLHQRALTATEVTGLHSGGANGQPLAEYLFEDSLRNTGANPDLASAAAIAYESGYADKALRVGPSLPTKELVGPRTITTVDSFSVGAWVNLADKGGYYAIASQDGDRNSGFLMRYSPDVDRFIVGMPSADVDGNAFQWAIGTSVPQAGVWTHVAAVYDTGNGKLFLYVNGVLEGQRDITTVFNAAGSFVVGAAKQNGVRGYRFNGLIDEVNVYDGPLNAAEAATLHNTPVERARYRLDGSPVDSVGGGTASLYGDHISWDPQNGTTSAHFSYGWHEHGGRTVTAQPSGEWHFEDGLDDTSGTGRTLTARQGTAAGTASYAAGMWGRSVALNGSDTYLRHDTPVLDTAANYSVSAYVKLDRADGSFTVASQDGARSMSFALRYNQTQNRWSFAATSGDTDNPAETAALSKNPPILGQWAHLLGVHDAAADKLRLYVNGVLEAETAYTAGWSSTGPFVVGAAKWNGNRVDFFPGQIDELRVYDAVLTGVDAHSLWNLASTIGVPRPNLLRTDKSFTVSAWAKPDVYDSTPRTVLSADGTYSPFVLTYRPEYRRFALIVFANGTNGANGVEGRWILSDKTAQDDVNADGWVHLAAVYDAPARKMRFLVNGVEQASYPNDGTTVSKYVEGTTAPSWYAGAATTLPDTGRGLLIGRVGYEGRSTDFWKGSVREVRVFTGVVPDSCEGGAPACLSQMANW